jgi:THO complex subunit 3
LQSKDVTFRGHGDSVDQLCWHPKHPDQLVTASGDKTIRMWDARTNKSIATVNTKGLVEIIILIYSFVSTIHIHK